MSKRCRPLEETESSVDTARVLMLLSQPQQHGAVGVENVRYGARQTGFVRAARARVFECQTCSRRFPTFQALGGHRASHKRPRPRAHAHGDVGAGLCLGRQPLEAHAGAGRARVHGCPVCGVVFAVGQALGGHMRRHRAAPDADSHGPGAATTVKVDNDGAGDECTGGICLGLNLTPSANCAKCRSAGLGAAVQSVQTTLLLDCSL